MWDPGSAYEPLFWTCGWAGPIVSDFSINRPYPWATGATAVGKGIFQPSNQFWEDDQAWERLSLALASCPILVGPVTILGQNDAISLHNQLVLNAGNFRKFLKIAEVSGVCQK